MDKKNESPRDKAAKALIRKKGIEVAKATASALISYFISNKSSKI